MARRRILIVVADLGGSNTDLLLADAGGAVLQTALCPAVAPSPTIEFVEYLLAPMSVRRAGVERIVVKEGHR